MKKVPANRLSICPVLGFVARYRMLTGGPLFRREIGPLGLNTPITHTMDATTKLHAPSAKGPGSSCPRPKCRSHIPLIRIRGVCHRNGGISAACSVMKTCKVKGDGQNLISQPTRGSDLMLIPDRILYCSGKPASRSTSAVGTFTNSAADIPEVFIALSAM